MVGDGGYLFAGKACVARYDNDYHLARSNLENNERARRKSFLYLPIAISNKASVFQLCYTEINYIVILHVNKLQLLWW